MRWVLAWKYTEGGDRKAKARLFFFCVSTSRAYKCTDSSTDTWKYVSSFVAAGMRPTQTSVHFGDVSSAFLQTSASEEHQELTIKAPPEAVYLFSNSERKPARCASDEIVLWTHVSTPCVMVGHHTETSSAWMETHADWRLIAAYFLVRDC